VISGIRAEKAQDEIALERHPFVKLPVPVMVARGSSSTRRIRMMGASHLKREREAECCQIRGAERVAAAASRHRAFDTSKKVIVSSSSSKMSTLAMSSAGRAAARLRMSSWFR
jgi:hypothetical protein